MRSQILSVLPVFIVLVIALGMTYLSVSVGAPRISIVPFSRESQVELIVVNTLFFVGITSLSIPLIYLALKKMFISIIEKIFVIGGGLLTVFSIGILSDHLIAVFPSFLTIFTIWMCYFLIALSTVFILTGVISEETRTAIFTMYSSVAGSFLGMGIPAFSTLLILMSSSLIDLIYFRTGLLKVMSNLSERGRILVRLKHADKELLIGLGDLIYYSMLASSSLLNFGFLTAAFSCLMILIGCILTFLCTTKIEIFPGLPIPIGLGLIPIALRLIGGV
jgi:hypothetical protein